MFIKIFLIGWVILISAIIANIIATRLGIYTWYPFIDEVFKSGVIKSFNETPFISKLFLFIIYPFILGLSAFFVFKFIK